MNEPVYIDQDVLENGGVNTRPKWQIPKTDLQIRFLAVVNARYWKSKETRSRFIIIEKSISDQLGTNQPYPRGWIEQCIKWAKKKNMSGGYITLDAVISLINNEDKRTQWAGRQPKINVEVDVDDPFN